MTVLSLPVTLSGRRYEMPVQILSPGPDVCGLSSRARVRACNHVQVVTQVRSCPRLVSGSEVAERCPWRGAST